MQKITTFLWFDSNAEEAVAFYLTVFKDGKIHTTTRYPDVANPPGKPGTVMTIAFELKGQQFVALNGGPGFPFTNAVSLVVNCDSQEAVWHGRQTLRRESPRFRARPGKPRDEIGKSRS